RRRVVVHGVWTAHGVRGRAPVHRPGVPPVPAGGRGDHDRAWWAAALGKDPLAAPVGPDGVVSALRGLPRRARAGGSGPGVRESVHRARLRLGAGRAPAASTLLGWPPRGRGP